MTDVMKNLIAAADAVIADRELQKKSGGAHFTSAQTEWEDKRESAKKAWDALRAATQAAREAGDGWIPVSERLPGAGEEVWCCDSVGQTFVANIDRFGGWREAGHYVTPDEDSAITHWQPLPEPPKEIQDV